MPRTDLDLSGPWETLEDKHFLIHHRPGGDEDGRSALTWARYARRILRRYHPHRLDGRVQVFLFDRSAYQRSPAAAEAHPETLEITFLAPSVNNFPEVWYRKNFVHEYAHLALRDLYAMRWRPAWFSEGLAEYIAVYRTSRRIRRYYNHYEHSLRRSAAAGHAHLLHLRDVYVWGSNIWRYIHDTYAPDSIQGMIRAATFNDALRAHLGVTPRQFEDGWLKWLARSFNLSFNQVAGRRRRAGASRTPSQGTGRT